MKLEKWALIAEISSGIAVVFTLVILIFGIQDNTNATRGSVYATSIESLNALNRTIMANSMDKYNLFGENNGAGCVKRSV